MCVPRSAYLAFLQYDDLIGMLHGRKPVRNNDTGTVLHQLIDSILHHTFTFGIQGRSGFIEYQYRRVFQYCPCNSNPLAFTTA